MFLSTVATMVSIVESALFLCFWYATTLTLNVVGLTKKRDHQTQWLPTAPSVHEPSQMCHCEKLKRIKAIAKAFLQVFSLSACLAVTLATIMLCMVASHFKICGLQDVSESEYTARSY